MSDNLCVHCGKFRAGTPALKVVKDGFANHFVDIIDPTLCGNCVVIPEETRKVQKAREGDLRSRAKKLIEEANALIDTAYETNEAANSVTGDKELSQEDIAARVDAIAGSKEARRV